MHSDGARSSQAHGGQSRRALSSTANSIQVVKAMLQGGWTARGSLQQNFAPAPRAVLDEKRVVKGVCAVCSKPVFATHARTKNSRGQYVHGECAHAAGLAPSPNKIAAAHTAARKQDAVRETAREPISPLLEPMAKDESAKTADKTSSAVSLTGKRAGSPSATSQLHRPSPQQTPSPKYSQSPKQSGVSPTAKVSPPWGTQKLRTSPRNQPLSPAVTPGKPPLPPPMVAVTVAETVPTVMMADSDQANVDRIVLTDKLQAKVQTLQEAVEKYDRLLGVEDRIPLHSCFHDVKTAVAQQHHTQKKVLHWLGELSTKYHAALACIEGQRQAHEMMQHQLATWTADFADFKKALKESQAQQAGLEIELSQTRQTLAKSEHERDSARAGLASLADLNAGLARLQQDLAAYKIEIEQLHGQKADLQQQNVKLHTMLEDSTGKSAVLEATLEECQRQRQKLQECNDKQNKIAFEREMAQQKEREEADAEMEEVKMEKERLLKESGHFQELLQTATQENAKLQSTLNSVHALAFEEGRAKMTVDLHELRQAATESAEVLTCIMKWMPQEDEHFDRKIPTVIDT